MQPDFGELALSSTADAKRYVAITNSIFEQIFGLTGKDCLRWEAVSFAIVSMSI